MLYFFLFLNYEIIQLNWMIDLMTVTEWHNSIFFAEICPTPAM